MVCPACGGPMERHGEATVTLWHLPMGVDRTKVEARRQRWACGRGRTCVEGVPFKADVHRITVPLMNFVWDLLSLGQALKVPARGDERSHDERRRFGVGNAAARADVMVGGLAAPVREGSTRAVSLSTGVGAAAFAPGGAPLRDQHGRHRARRCAGRTGRGGCARRGVA